ncbi:MAG TPA: hypothetical protein VF253_04745 [Candidatus Limnocylindrales bacterium]
MSAERAGGTLLILGGLAAVPLWLVFTNVHGPTSFNENHVTLGLDMHAWGLLLGVIPNVLVAAGLWLARPVLVLGGGPLTRLGYGLVLAGVLASAVLDLLWRALGPPLLMPLIAAGLLTLALAPRRDAGSMTQIRGTLLILGVLLAVAFLWALTPLDVFDSVGGYRIYGAMAHLLGGLAWAVVGLLVLRRDPAAG